MAATDDLTPGLFQEVNRQSLLTVANHCQWNKMTDLTSLPTDETDGVDVAERPVALLSAFTRKRMHHHSAWLVIDTHDDTADYTVTVDGNSVTYTASSGESELDTLKGIRDAINNDATVSGIVTADLIDDDEDGTDDTVRLRGDDSDSYDVAVSATGAAAVSETHDATSFDLLVFSYPRDTGPNGNNPNRWGYHGMSFQVDWRGINKVQIPCNAMQLLDFVVRNADGQFDVFAGPARLES
ncbi:MAG: hypothetical protein ABEN55_00660 [Bradymonadaceae bacterium]